MAELSDAAREALVASSLEKIKPEVEPDPRGRASAGRVLGLVGDPRPGVGVKPSPQGLLLPDIDWVTIPAGEFIYGDDNKDAYPEYAQPADQQVLTLPEFQISRYPVTYAQFQTFVDDPDGFAQDRWWEGMPEEDRVRELSEQEFKYANHPRENVSWYQAVAFCRWLSWRLQRATHASPLRSDDPTNLVVRLPTEMEWEKAARGTGGWVYPYGNGYNANKGNVRMGIGMTSAVGIFPDGASPYGVLDMSGNVWEWCRNKYGAPEEMDVDQSGDSRVLRGGSFSGLEVGSRSAFRLFNLPNGRDGDLGFRLVVVRMGVVSPMIENMADARLGVPTAVRR